MLAQSMPSWLDFSALIGGLDFTSGLQLIERGGPVVVIIGIMSILSLAVGLFKLIHFMVRGVGRGRGIEEAIQAWLGGAHERAISSIDARTGPAASVLRHAMAGIASGESEAVVREDAERLALGALAELRRHLRVIEATSQVAPLLGLFGTVIGMMGAFQSLQAAGSASDPAALAGGIWVALITTAVGLAAAMPAALALYWFEGRIEREKAIIEDALTSVFTNRLVATYGNGAVVSLPHRAPPASAAE